MTLAMSDSRKFPTDAAAAVEREISGGMRSSGVLDGPRMGVTEVARPAAPVVGHRRPADRPAYDRVPATCHVNLVYGRSTRVADLMFTLNECVVKQYTTSDCPTLPPNNSSVPSLTFPIVFYCLLCNCEIKLS